MNADTRWGFWGAGAIAHRVAQDLRRVTGARLVGVASRSPASASAFSAAHGLPRVHADLQALLNDYEVDVVYVATPHHRHAEDAIACLRAGKAVLCEKPFALTESQAAQIIAESRLAGRFCMEAMWMRFIPAVHSVVQMVKDGAIGKIRLLAGDFAYPTEFDASSRLFSPELGGGALLDRGTYLLSLAQALLGEPVTVQASAQLAATNVDELSTYQLQYADGATAQFWAGLAVRGTNSVVIIGDQGHVHLHEPFYAAHRFSVTRDATERVSSRGADVANAGFGGRLKGFLAQHGVNRRIDWLRNAQQHIRSRSLPFAGNGYQFELAEVARCLQAGLVESALMPLADSQAVARTTDRLRACWRRPEGPLTAAQDPFV